MLAKLEMWRENGVKTSFAGSTGSILQPSQVRLKCFAHISCNTVASKWFMLPLGHFGKRKMKNVEAIAIVCVPIKCRLLILDPKSLDH